MKAMVCTHYGPPEVLQLREVAKPIPKPKEVLIKNYTEPSGKAPVIHPGDEPPFLIRDWVRLGPSHGCRRRLDNGEESK